MSSRSPDEMLIPTTVEPGDGLWALDAFGRWLGKEATSGIETAGPSPKRHDFAGVYVRPPHSKGRGVFWPLEDLRSHGVYGV